jgi:hypothetical protein
MFRYFLKRLNKLFDAIISKLFIIRQKNGNKINSLIHWQIFELMFENFLFN